MIDGIREKMIFLLEPYLASKGFDLIDVSVRGTRREYTVEILTDKPNGGITIGECATLNRQIGSFLDQENILDGDYTLDVSSPGIDRPLMSVKDFLRSLGKEVICYLKEPVRGKMEYRGIVQRVQDEHVDIKHADMEVSIPIQSINNAKQVI